MERIRPRHAVVAIIALVFAVAVVPRAFTDQPGTRKVQGTEVAVTIAAVKTNAVARYRTRLTEGGDPQHEIQHMVEALTGLPGVGEAALDAETLELAVTYDDSVIDDGPIRDRLMEAGYVVPTRDDATPTLVAADGSAQRIAITDDGRQFEPYLVLAMAGVPIEMQFAPGWECRVVVKFPELGIEQDIAAGGTVALPALEPGDYTILCGGDAQEATLFVQ